MKRGWSAKPRPQRRGKLARRRVYSALPPEYAPHQPGTVVLARDGVSAYVVHKDGRYEKLPPEMALLAYEQKRAQDGQ